jgi:hypothetical protein
MQRDIGGQGGQAYLFDRLDLNRSIHRRFVLIEEWAGRRERRGKDGPYKALTE